MSNATTTRAATDTTQRATFAQLVGLVYFSISNMGFPISFEKNRAQGVLKKMGSNHFQKRQIEPSAKQIRGL